MMTTLSVIGGCTIPAGQSLSNAVDCTGANRIVRINMPPEWDGAVLTFMLSPDGGVFHDLFHVTIPGDAFHTYEVIVTPPHAGSVIVMPLDFGNDVAWVKVRSGTSGVPVVQSADRSFSFVCEMPDAAPAPAKHARLPLVEGKYVTTGTIHASPSGPVGLSG
jgi:hypothetical protein